VQFSSKPNCRAEKAEVGIAWPVYATRAGIG
jgi:hypothetical protein